MCPLWRHVTHFAAPGSAGGVIVQADAEIIGFRYGKRTDANHNIVLDAVGALATPRDTVVTPDE